MTDPSMVLVMDGEQLDKLVARHVRGWEWRRPTHGNCCTCQRCGRDHDDCNAESYAYSRDMAGALPVLEAMEAAGWSYDICSRLRLVTFTKGKTYQTADADNVPTAICRAAVRARLLELVPANTKVQP